MHRLFLTFVRDFPDGTGVYRVAFSLDPVLPGEQCYRYLVPSAKTIDGREVPSFLARYGYRLPTISESARIDPRRRFSRVAASGGRGVVVASPRRKPGADHERFFPVIDEHSVGQRYLAEGFVFIGDCYLFAVVPLDGGVAS